MSDYELKGNVRGDLANDVWSQLSTDRGLGKKITEESKKSLSEPLKGTSLEKPVDIVDKATNWLNKGVEKMAGKENKKGNEPEKKI